MQLNQEDVFTLMGDAEVRRFRGEADMPDYLYDLAKRIALTIGEEGLAERVTEVADANARKALGAGNGN